MNRWVLGVTGGIGAGKTAITDFLSLQGITVVDADLVAREVVAKGSEGLKHIIDAFGSTILTAQGELNRGKLRQLIFKDEHLKNKLNSILHPLIRETLLLKLSQATSQYVVLSAPLLFENDLQRFCDATLLVDVAKETQLERTTQRDQVDFEQVESIIAAQMPREEKQKRATWILNNDRSLPETHIELLELHQRFIKLSETS